MSKESQTQIAYRGQAGDNVLIRQLEWPAWGQLSIQSQTSQIKWSKQNQCAALEQSDSLYLLIKKLQFQEVISFLLCVHILMFPCTLGLVRIPHRLILPLTWYRAPAHCHSQGTLGFFCELMSSLSSVNHLVLQKSSIACWLIQDSRCRAWTGILVSCPFSHHLHSQNPVGISQFYFIFLKKKFNHGFLLPLIK